MKMIPKENKEDEDRLYQLIKTLRGNYTKKQFQEAGERISRQQSTESEVMVFTSRRFKDLACNNPTLNIFMESLAHCLHKLNGSKIKDGYGFLEQMGRHLLKSHLPIRKIRSTARHPAGAIASLASFWVREGLAKKVIIIHENNSFTFQIYRPFGSQVCAEIFQNHGIRHIRPCPLQAMLMAKCLELGYDTKYVSLKFDDKKDVWYITIQLLPIRYNRYARAK